jgi:hypothetical protein
MRVEFEGIVNALEMNNPFAKDLRQRVLALCTSPENARVLLLELNHEEKEDGCMGDHALFCILKSCAYDQLGFKISAFAEAVDAVKGYRQCGEKFNEALAHWYIGLLYKLYEEDHLAIPQLGEAVKLLSTSAKFHEMESNYAKKVECEKWILKIKAMITVIQEKDKTKPHAPPPPEKYPSSWKGAVINLGGYASEEVVLKGKSYLLFESPRGNVIEPSPGSDSQWVKADDNSMDRATPIPIEPDDYLLTDRKLMPRYNDIVIAHQITPAPAGKTTHMLFRFTDKGLKTESSFTSLEIPFDCVDFMVVVIAIAKLV